MISMLLGGSFSYNAIYIYYKKLYGEPMIDSYEALIPNYISKEDFFKFGVEKTIFIPDDKVKQEWKKLKELIQTNNPVYMRGVKEAAGNHLFFDYYAKIFNNDQVKKDPSNTQNPAKVIEALTGYKKSKDLRNYQLTSIFGRSRNILAFTAPWNIAYIPSILDPLLSAEAKGDLALEFQTYFMKHAYEKFKPYIDEFNKMLTTRQFIQSTNDHFEHLYNNNRMYDRKSTEKFEEVFRKDFEPIKFS